MIINKLKQLHQSKLQSIFTRLSLNDVELLDNELAKSSFYHFTKLIIGNIGAKNKIDIADHIKIMCEVLQLKYDKKLKHLAVGISIPPGHTKTLCANVCYAAWVLGKMPNTRIILTMNSMSEAIKANQDLKEVLQSELYLKIFPNTILSNDNTTWIQTTKGGGRRALTTNITKKYTGADADLLQIDDPNDTTATLTILQQTIDWYEKKGIRRLRSGINNLGMLLIQQRVDMLDLTGYLLENSKDFYHLCLKAEEEEDVVYKIPLKNGAFHDIHRKAGYLWETFNNENNLVSYDRIKNNEYKKDVWETQYQQSPNTSKDSIIQQKWLLYEDPNVVYARQYERIIMSCDTAISEKTSADFTAITIWGQYKGKHYLLGIKKGRWQPYESYNQIAKIYNNYHNGVHPQSFKSSVLLIEKASSGTSLLSFINNGQMYKDYGVQPNAIGIAVSKSKVERLMSCQSMIQAGNVIFPKSERIKLPWLTDFEHELLYFQNGAKHDDQVDSMTLYLNYCIENNQRELRIYYSPLQ